MTDPSPSTTDPSPFPLPPTPTPRDATAGALLAKNAGWGLASQLAPMVAAVAAIPVLIAGVGTDRFGVLTIATMTIGYFNLFDLGLGRALTRLVADELGRGREDDVPALAWTALTMMTALGAVGGLLVASAAPWLVSDALKVPESLRGESLGAFYLLAACLPFVIGTAGLRGILEAYQKLGAANAVRTVFGLSTQIGPLLVLPFSRSLVPVVAVLAAGRFAMWAVHVMICLREVPALRSGSTFRPALVRRLLGFGGWMTLTNAVNPLLYQVDRFLIGGLLSTAAVAYYTTPFEVVTKLWAVTGAVLGVLFPAFATRFARDRVGAVDLFGRGLKFIFLIAFPPTLLLIGLSAELLTLWLGPEFAIRSAGVLRWLAFGVFVNSLSQVPSSLLQAIGRPDLPFKIHLVEVPFYVAASWFLIDRHGIEGAAAAWAVRIAIDMVLFFWAARRLLPEASGALGKTATAIAGASIALAAASAPVGLSVRGPYLVVVLIAFAYVAWSRVLAPDERAAVVSLAPGVFRYVRRCQGRAAALAD